MDIELLRTLPKVVRLRHIGKAAAELCMTRSAVYNTGLDREYSIRQALGLL